MADTEKNPRNAGRKCKGAVRRVRVGINFDPAILESLRRQSAETGESMNDIANRALAAVFTDPLAP
jgi:hypothetical protein